MTVRLECPRCGSKSETEVYQPRKLNCGDCLIERVEIVKLIPADDEAPPAPTVEARRQARLELGHGMPSTEARLDLERRGR